MNLASAAGLTWPDMGLKTPPLPLPDWAVGVAT